MSIFPEMEYSMKEHSILKFRRAINNDNLEEFRNDIRKNAWLRDGKI